MDKKETLKVISIRDIPVELWNAVRAMAILKGKTARQVVIELFQEYIKRG